MLFYDATSQSKDRCAVRYHGNCKVLRWWDGKIEMYPWRGDGWRYPHFLERVFIKWASVEHKDWDSA